MGLFGASARVSAPRISQAERERGQRLSLYSNLVGQGMEPALAELVMTNPDAFGDEFRRRYGDRVRKES